ncbi:MAG: hypothetical protein F6K31_01425 [Symploca sp. SIO2G7]|nr:hypothetical protein [Symploca sp. SIO2G7]
MIVQLYCRSDRLRHILALKVKVSGLNLFIWTKTLTATTAKQAGQLGRTDAEVSINSQFLIQIS